MRLIFWSLASFFLVVISSLVITTLAKQKAPIQPQRFTSPQTRKFYPPIPVLKADAIKLELSAYAVYAMDLDSGITLYEKNASEKVLPASTTKIITALVSLDYYPLDKILTVGEIKVDGQKMKLVPGEKIMVSDLILGLLIYSANDAAEVLAQNYPGGKENFVKDMNLKAKEINLDNTFYTNPEGYDEDNHKTTARDLVRLASYAMKYDFFAKTVSQKETTVLSVDKKFKHRLANLNQLIGKVEGVLGVKTGWTENAKENLVTYVERDGKRIMIALLGSEDRFGETKRLIEWIFSSYEWKEVEGP